MNLNDSMKAYEAQEADRMFMPYLPILARLDGKCFHTFTHDLERPYDDGFCNLMIEVTRYLVQETGALAGYTQSDEITLLFYSDTTKKPVFFDGRIQKMTSLLAALCSVSFNTLQNQYLPYSKDQTMLPVFDCRCWQVPNKTEASNVFLWREQDATKNSLFMATSQFYSHEELLNKGASDQHELLFQKGVNWNNYPAFFKRGTFIQRSKNETSGVRVIEMPPFGRVINREAVLFEGVQPLVAKQPQKE